MNSLRKTKQKGNSLFDVSLSVRLKIVQDFFYYHSSVSSFILHYYLIFSKPRGHAVAFHMGQDRQNREYSMTILEPMYTGTCTQTKLKKKQRCLLLK